MIGIIGTGVMARGIALQVALCGQDVIVVGRHAGNVEACRGYVTDQLALLGEKPTQTASAQTRSARAQVRSTLDYADLSACDAVIETVSEDLDAKRAVLLETERHIQDSCLLLTCTSSISIAELATALRRPERFIGMHFFNPAHIMPLVEVVPHDRTGPDTLERAKALAATLGKRAILVKDTPGFFVNRVLFAYIQGFCTLLKDTLDHERIDDIMVRSGWPMGPAALLDAIGIDTCLDIGRILVRAFPDTFSAAFLPVLEPLVRRGWTGRKSGVGFYRYSNDEGGNAVGEANGKAIGLWGNLRNGSATHVVPAEEILDRLMLPVTNEVFRCIEEGVISGPEQADQAIFLSMGYGRKGGVCKQLRKAGVGSHLAKCGKYQSLGDIYRPPGYLLALAK